MTRISILEKNTLASKNLELVSQLQKIYTVLKDGVDFKAGNSGHRSYQIGREEQKFLLLPNRVASRNLLSWTVWSNQWDFEFAVDGPPVDEYSFPLGYGSSPEEAWEELLEQVLQGDPVIWDKEGYPVYTE